MGDFFYWNRDNLAEDLTKYSSLVFASLWEMMIQMTFLWPLNLFFIWGKNMAFVCVGYSSSLSKTYRFNCLKHLSLQLQIYWRSTMRTEFILQLKSAPELTCISGIFLVKLYCYSHEDLSTQVACMFFSNPSVDNNALCNLPPHFPLLDLFIYLLSLERGRLYLVIQLCRSTSILFWFLLIVPETALFL